MVRGLRAVATAVAIAAGLTAARSASADLITFDTPGDLDANFNRVGTATGATSGSVRLELQADCYAGVWANHATNVPDSSGQVLITEITNADLDNALETAASIGDDYIQTNLAGQQVDTSSFSHGSSAQRQKWLLAGHRSGDPNSCNTFDTSDLG